MRAEDLLARIQDASGASVFVLDDGLDRYGAEAIEQALQGHGFHTAIVELRCSDGDVEQTLMDQLDRGFQFPDYFGQNWNAVDECITDLSWLPAVGYCCLVLNHKALKESAPHAERMFVSLMSDASMQWSKEGKRFCVVLSP